MGGAGVPMKHEITDEKLNNTKFRKSEIAILLSFSSSKSVVKVSPSTISRHHGGIDNVLPNYSRYIIRKYTKYVNSLTDDVKGVLRKKFQRMLLFIFKNKIVLGVLMENEKIGVFEKIVEMTEPAGFREYGRMTLKVYEKEITGVIEIWGVDGFRMDRMTQILNVIMDLTDSVETRLVSLGK